MLNLQKKANKNLDVEEQAAKQGVVLLRSIKRETKVGYSFLFISLLGTSVFLLIPYIDVFRRSFSSTIEGAFAGFDNFVEVIKNEAFQLAMKNTFSFVAVCIPLLLVISLAIALFIYHHTGIASWMKTGFLLPMAIPVASIVLVWRLIFDPQGFLNHFLDKLGVQGLDWMNTDAAFWILVFSYIWKNLGYNIVLWIAGLSTISPDIFEAAKMDGANSWKCFTKITLPNLLPSLFIISVLALLNSFKVFREAYLVAGDYPHDSMYMLQHLFNNWFRDLSLDKMAAGAVLNSIVLILLILLWQKFWNKGGGE